MKLTASQIGARIGVNSYTVKRWYEFYKDLDEDEILNLHEQGMPLLPEYEVIKREKREDRLWDEKDVERLAQFRDWVPPTRRGIFSKYKKESN